MREEKQFAVKKKIKNSVRNKICTKKTPHLSPKCQTSMVHGADTDVPRYTLFLGVKKSDK